MKIYLALSIFAFAALSAFAVWFGALNQDEGWYIYASQLVAEGQIPYKDFSYTQGPLMPLVYSAFAPLWNFGGILAARIFTLCIGTLGILANVCLARSLAEGEEGKKTAGIVAFLLLACNVYHVYYVSIPKTYALAGLFASFGALLAVRAARRGFGICRMALLFASGMSMSLAAGVRISMGTMLAASAIVIMFSPSMRKRDFLAFCAGGAVSLAVVYLPYLLDADAFSGLCAAQKYHAARKGFSPLFTVGSISRLVRWYLPLFIVAGLNVRFIVKKGDAASQIAFFAFLSVFLLQAAAPFPYEDYQVPVMGILAALVASAAAAGSQSVEAGTRAAGRVLLLSAGLAFASSFGSPLLEKWMTDGQDRLWPLKKDSSELSILRQTAKFVNELDPGGDTILTQDLYLAVETGRKVPKGLEMGPFSILTQDEWCELLSNSECPVAALSGYSFAIEPPECGQRPLEEQLLYWAIVKSRYDRVKKVDRFGQNSTPLMILTRK